jgi:hypothetical protein
VRVRAFLRRRGNTPPQRSALTVGFPFTSFESLLAERRMSISRKRIFHLAAPPPTTIYVRPGYNRVLAEDHGTPDALSIG